LSATESAHHAAGADRAVDQGGIGRPLVILLAVACGATVANLYYAQPLLSSIARSLGVSDGSAGLLVTASQICYAVGLVLLVPLGDLVDRRRLVVRLLSVCAVAMGLASVAPSFALLAVGLGIASAASVVVQILVPFASTLASADDRGRIVGLVMSGVLTGILLARTVSGLVAGLLGWRAPFIVAAALMIVLAITLWRALPMLDPPVTMPYRRLLASVGRLVATEPRLRRRMVYGACGFAGFSAVWTTVAFLLSGPPFHYGSITIGLFGLAGLLGAVGASGVGKLADRGLGRAFTGFVLLLVLSAWAVLVSDPHTVVGVVIGLVLLDFGVQGANVLSQHVIYGLGSENASRVTTAYVTGNFVGGAIGSAAGSLAWEAGGWSAVCATGAAIALVAFAFWLTEAKLAFRSDGRDHLQAQRAEPLP
jgi:predicted MFS family arabinose efflux permease